MFATFLKMLVKKILTTVQKIIKKQKKSKRVGVCGL
jgi:hypothetical protein